MDFLRRAHGETRPRWGLLLLTVLQLLVVVAVPAADAALEAASVGVPTHVEAPTDEACGTHHDHLFCQLCRVLGLSALPGVATSGAGLFGAAVHGLEAPPAAHLPAGSPLAGSLGARGPPSA